MPRLAIIADTHVPARADEIPVWVIEEIENADHTIHAGDVESAETLATVSDHATGLTAVTGNMDSGLGLPEIATIEIGGVTFVVTHGHIDIDSHEDIAAIVREEGDGSAIGVSGHTHQLFDAEVDGVRLLNPGSATGADPASTTSMMVVEVEDGELDVTVRER